jgi:drug/metabolite transporter (DMT)-like permease
MNSWIFYAVVAVLQVGLMSALYKVPAAKQMSKYALLTWSFFFSVVTVGVVFHQYIVFDITTILYASVWGAGYAALTLTQMHALHKYDTSEVFPFTSLLSNILVVLGGVLFFNEIISLVQWIAVVVSVYLFVAAHWNSKVHFFAEVFPVFMAIVFFSTFSKFVQKLGADVLEMHNFIFWEFVFAFVASLIMFAVTTKKGYFPKTIPHKLLGWALAIGLLNVGTNYATIKALSLGPVSLVYVVIGLYTFFTAIFAALLFKEKITKKHVMYITMSFLVILLIKFG